MNTAAGQHDKDVPKNPRESSHNAPWHGALRVAAVSLGIRLAWALYATVIPVSDFAGYDNLAIRLLGEGEFRSPGGLAYRTPAYPAFLAGIYAVFGHSWKAAMLAQAALGAIASGLVVRVAGRMLSPRASVMAGLFHAFLPTPVAYVAVLASENLTVPLTLGSILCLMRVHRTAAGRHLPWAALGGVLMGLTLLSRPAMLFTLPALGLYSLYDFASGQKSFRAGSVFVLGALVTVAPWLGRNAHHELGPFTLTTVGGVNLWMGNNPLSTDGGYCGRAQLLPADLPEARRHRQYRDAALNWMRSNPAQYARHCLARAARLFGVEPDFQAASYLSPTEQNARAVAGLYEHQVKGEPVKPTEIQLGRKVQQRNEAYLRWLQTVLSPLLLMALLLSLARWRLFAPVSLTAVFYSAGIIATYFEPRFREVVIPLLLIPLAGLVSDVAWGTTDLGRHPGRGVKTALTVIALHVYVFLAATGNFDAWGRLPQAGEDRVQETLGYFGFTFEDVPVQDPQAWDRSFWDYDSQVTVTPSAKGVRCEVVPAQEGASRSHYGGVMCRAPGARLVRLELSFTDPEHIRTVYCDMATDDRRVHRWRWEAGEVHPIPRGRQRYLLVPGKRSGPFQVAEHEGFGEVTTLHVFIKVAAGQSAGFTLHRLQTAQ